MLVNVGRGDDIYSDFNSSTRSDIDFKSFSTNFIETFYFFAGFEIYSTLNKNLKNPRRDLPVAMALVMLATTIFYCFVIVCFLGTLTQDHDQFQKNPAFKLFGQLFGNKKWLTYLFAFAMVICFLSVKFSATMEGTLYANSIILPMVNDGYLPAVLEKDPKDNITNNTVKFYMASALIMYFFVVILVDIYQGAVGADKSPLGYSKIIGVATLIILPVYSLVLYLALKLSYTKHIKSSIFEMTAWGVTLFFFFVQIFK